MKKYFETGQYMDHMDNVGVGVGRPQWVFDQYYPATLTDLKISVKHNHKNCEINWQPCDGADRYRVDLYLIEQTGPEMYHRNFICTQCEWTADTTFTTQDIEIYKHRLAIVFAYKGDELLGIYNWVYCVTAPYVVGDMLEDKVEDFATRKYSAKEETSMKLAPLPAEKSVLLNSNPDRGWRSEEDYFIPAEDEIPDWTPEDYYNDVVARIKSNIQDQTVKVSRIYFILTKYINTPVLPQKVIDYMQGYYDAYRKAGVKLYLGHYYQHFHKGENVSTEIATAHFEQLAPLFEKNADVIYVFSLNWIGCYGEWTNMRSPFNYDIFVEKALKLIPKQLRILMRHNYTKKLYVPEDHPRFKQIGFANEAIHGLRYYHSDIGQGYSQPGSVWWNNVIKESPYTINEGELFTTRAIRVNSSWSSGIENMQVFSQQHMTTISVNHGYGDIRQFGGALDQTNIYAWKSEEVTEDLLDELGLAYTTGWFIDGSGEKVKRNSFEYIRDHLGYRLSAKKFTFKQEGNELAVKLDLKNYGCGAAFNIKSGFALLDKAGNVICEIEAGDPATWYVTDPENYENRQLLTHTVEAKLPLNGVKDSYYVGFYLKGTLGDTARLDNSIQYINGYNILCEIKR